ARPTRGPASGSRCAARSSSTTAAGCGSTPTAARGRPSASLFRPMTSPEQTEPITVLLVEDDPGDVVLIQEAFEHNKVRNDLHIVGDGVEALDFLRSGGPRPDLILLDLNLPRKDGREVLAEVKGDSSLRSIPVVVLTTSKAEEDILRSYDL